MLLKVFGTEETGPRGGRSASESSKADKREATSTSEKETSEKKRQERDADIDMAKVDKLLSKSS